MLNMGAIRGVQVAVLLGSYFGTHLVLKVSNFPEEIVSKGDEHRLARQNVIFFISESRNYHVGTKIGPQKCPHMFFLIVGYLYSLG